MARPQSDILNSTQINDQLITDILEAQGHWIVVYKLKPINIRQKYWNVKGEMHKYVRTSYPSSAPAYNLAKKLNTEFMTNDFSVIRVL